MTMLYAATELRLECITAAEKELGNYKHRTQFDKLPRIETTEVSSPIETLETPFFIYGLGKPGTPENRKEFLEKIKTKEPQSTTRVYIQALASIDWIIGMTNAKPLSWTGSPEANACNGYTLFQIEMLTKLKNKIKALYNQTEETEYSDPEIIKFGEQVFITYAHTILTLNSHA
jgi:hypothetical protein